MSKRSYILNDHSMKKFYFFLLIVAFCPRIAISQDCSLLVATYTTYESRCAATGSIKVVAGGGSGSYKYKMTGPVNTNFTSADSITGLAAGTYILTVNDIATNCNRVITNVIIPGTYEDPRFTLTKTDVTCDNSSNGSITVSDQLFGRAPFLYTIVAPSPMGIGTSNATGVFPNLSAGTFSIRLSDSCGGIQTRQITIVNYTWWIQSFSFTKIACDTATGSIVVKDSKGNISTVSGIPGFTYGIVRSPGDTIWSTSPLFTFALLGNPTFQVIAKDSCGIIKKAVANVNLVPSVSASVTVYNKQCSTFSVKLNNILNFFTPDFCLYNSSNVLISCNTTGTFTNIPYGSYCIKAHDSCTDTTITRCFTATPPPLSINNTISISNKVCSTFTAAVTGQVGLTNPSFCIYNASNVLISCNATGVFTLLPYGSYCIKTTDGCRDTTITKCFTVLRPVPNLPPVLLPSYVTCTGFGVIVTGDSTSAPLYCLYDSNGVLIICNNTGIFDSIPLGTYCINMYDSCYDTTIIRCITVGMPVLTNDLATVVSNKTCVDFTVTATSSNLTTPNYCLYTSGGSMIRCDSSGIFNNLPYGSYCIRAKNSCPDTTMIKCFTVSQPVPSVDVTIRTDSYTCSTFNATVTGLVNIQSADFCIYDNNDSLVTCDPRGEFLNLLYGSYCIKIRDGCYDTTILRCFTVNPVPVTISGYAVPSCSIGYAQFQITLTNTNNPVNVKIYRPDSTLFSSVDYSASVLYIDSIPAVIPGQFYKIVIRDNCGRKDSLLLGAVASFVNRVPVVKGNCPGAGWSNGSGDIITTVTTNLGAITVSIIKKDGVLYAPPLLPNTVTASSYSFLDLGPGTYIIKAVENFCNNGFYDTVIVQPYQFPNLNRSSAYQCDLGGFSVSAVATDGVGPFMYEIIGSIPATPSIISGPQASPIFNINNGSNYSLIRLRAVDACGNATLGDASILPLAINGIINTWNCFNMATTLSVDPIYNSTYSWYKKDSLNAIDSTFMGAGSSLFIPIILPGDTGYYVCHLSALNGCIKRSYYYHLDGSCNIVLPIVMEDFKGRTEDDKNYLSWKMLLQDEIDHFVMERKNGNNSFNPIGRVEAIKGPPGGQRYNFTDHFPLPGKNYYRLKMNTKDLMLKMSNIVVLENKKTGIDISIYPNPVSDKLTIAFGDKEKHRYTISLFNMMNQLVKVSDYNTVSNNKTDISVQDIAPGFYVIKIYNPDTKEVFSSKLIIK